MQHQRDIGVVVLNWGHALMSIDTSSRDRAGRPILRILFSALALMVLSGCAVLINPTTIASAVVDGISYATTGKGSADHVISGLTDQDCAMHRGFTDKPVCNPSKDEGNLIGVEPKSEDRQEVTNLAVSEGNLPLFISGASGERILGVKRT